MTTPRRPTVREVVDDVRTTLTSQWFAGGLVFLALLAVTVVAALLLAGALVAAGGASPTEALTAMLRGSLGSVVAITTTLNYAAPLLMVAVGTCIAGRSGLINIGQEGQLICGAMLGGAAGLSLTSLNGWLLTPLVLLASAVGGAIWAGIAAWMKYKRGVNETISTLLLTFVALQLLSFTLNRPWLLEHHFAAAQALSANPQSDILPAQSQLPVLATGAGYQLNISFVVAFAFAVLVGFLLDRSVWGFRVRMVGLNARTALRAGVSGPRIGSGALMFSGATSGLAAGLMLTGIVPFLEPGFANNFGWDGLLVALVASFRVQACVPVALVFGGLRAGGGVLATRGINMSLVDVAQALVVLAVTIPAIIVGFRRQRAMRRVPPEPPTEPAVAAAGPASRKSLP